MSAICYVVICFNEVKSVGVVLQAFNLVENPVNHLVFA
jgi:hypothetical protein